MLTAEGDSLFKTVRLNYAGAGTKLVKDRLCSGNAVAERIWLEEDNLRLAKGFRLIEALGPVSRCFSLVSLTGLSPGGYQLYIPLRLRQLNHISRRL